MVHTMKSFKTIALARKATKRRQYEPAFKRHLVELSLVPGASVAKIALDHRLNANILFKWRRYHLRELARSTPKPLAGHAARPYCSWCLRDHHDKGRPTRNACLVDFRQSTMLRHLRVTTCARRHLNSSRGIAKTLRWSSGIGTSQDRRSPQTLESRSPGVYSKQRHSSQVVRETPKDCISLFP
jgi:hypothetical protein